MAEPVKEQLSTSQESEGRYVYAVIDDSVEQEMFDNVGVDGARVYTLGDGRHAAVVSDVPNRRIRPERRRVAAHHEVLKRLMVAHSVLPMSFGMIADNARSGAPHSRCRTGPPSPHNSAGCEAKSRWARESCGIKRIFMNTLSLRTSDLKTYRDRLSGGREPSREEKIALGRLFDNVLSAARADTPKRSPGRCRRGASS